MVERGTREELPLDVLLAKELITKVSDINSFTSFDEVSENLKNLAEAFIAKGNYFFLMI